MNKKHSLTDRKVYRKKVLYKFLKEKCLLRVYLDNLCHYQNIDINSINKNNLFQTINSIEGDFVWIGTKEGDDFWRKLSIEYVNYRLEMENG